MYYIIIFINLLIVNTQLNAFLEKYDGRDPNETEVILLTEMNREHDGDDSGKGAMQGGWGPHLRSIMRAPGGALWFAIDEAVDVYHNNRINYYKFEGSEWVQVAENVFDSSFQIQQNTAHIMLDKFLVSYGIDIKNQQVIECFIDTSDLTNKSCDPVVVGNKTLTLTPNSNYIGAAVSPSGYRVIWWTSVGSPGTFYHLWNFGSGWNGPVGTPINVSGNNYEYIGYVRSDFVDDYNLEMLGLSGWSSNSVYVALNISITLDNSYPHAEFSWIGSQKYAMSPRDIWVEDLTKDLHAIAAYTDENGVYGNTAYYYKPKGGVWVLMQHLPATNQARFHFDERNDLLYLILGKKKGAVDDEVNIQVRSAHRNSILNTGWVDWLGKSYTPAPILHEGFEVPQAIYNQSRSYQTTMIDCLNFAVVGMYPEYDNFIASYQGLSCVPNK